MLTIPEGSERADWTERQVLSSVAGSTVGAFLGTGIGNGRSPTGGERSPSTAGLLAAVFYATIPTLQFLISPTSPDLLLLSCWGVVYFGLVVALTRRTSIALLEILDLLP